MAIKNMINTRSPGELRVFQTRMVTVGRIRLGIYATPEGKRPRPEKLDRFRFTSPDEALIRAVAEQHGGTVVPWSPANDAKRREWEVISETAELPVYIVNGQGIDPTYEAWAAGRTCTRRCDGEWNSQGPGEPCVCNGLHPDKRPPAPKDMCKPTTRVQVMLQQVQGIGSWMLESHGENAAAEMGLLAGFVATAPVPVPAMLRLEFEVRREWNPAPFKGEPRFETREFYVPRFHISAVNARQIAVGGDALTQSLMAAGAPAALSGDTRRALEAAPVSAVPVSTPAVPEGISPDLRAKILTDIESRTTLVELDAVKVKLQTRGVTDKAVREAWRSRYDAVEAAGESQGDRGLPYPTDAEMDAVGPDCCRGFRSPADTWEPCDPCPIMVLRDQVAAHPDRAAFADELGQYDEAVARGATHEAILHIGGPAHWLATDDQHQHAQEEALNPDPAEAGERRPPTPGEAAWTPPGVLGDMFEGPVEGTVEGTADPLPMVPDGDYDAEELYAALMTGASKQTPPLTTDEVTALIRRTFSVEHHGEATGLQLARLRAGLKAEAVRWR